MSAALPPAINSATTRPLASARAAGTTRSRSTLLARKDEKRFLLLLTSAMSRRMPCSMLDAALFLRAVRARERRERVMEAAMAASEKRTKRHVSVS